MATIYPKNHKLIHCDSDLDLNFSEWANIWSPAYAALYMLMHVGIFCYLDLEILVCDAWHGPGKGKVACNCAFVRARADATATSERVCVTVCSWIPFAM